MPTALIDDFSDPTLWQPLTPADAPSPEIVLAAATGPAPVPGSAGSMRVDISGAASGHRFERTLQPVDLSGFGEMRLWIRSNTSAAGTAGAPFRLTLRLGSPALPVGAVGNDWLRHIPVERTNQWSLVRLALDDLAPAVRGAVDTIALSCQPALTPVTVWLDDLRAAAHRMAVDADAALVAALDGGLVLSGNPVTAAIATPGAPVVAAPWIRIVTYDAAFAERRGNQGRRRADYTDTGHRIWPEPEPWDLFYRIDFVTSAADEQAAMLDFVLATLGGRGTLDVGGLAHPLERVPNILPEDAVLPAPLLRYRLATWLERGQPVVATPVTEVRLAADALG